MMRVYAVLLGLLLIVPSAAFGASVTCTGGASTGVSVSTVAPAVPLAGMAIGDGQFIDLSQCIVAVGKDMFQLSAAVVDASGDANITATFDGDPFISFGVTTTSLLPGPTAFSFLFGTPVAAGLYSSATSTAGVTVTNGLSGTSGVAVSGPTYLSGFGTVFSTPTNLGVDLGTAPCVSGPGAAFTITHTCAQGTATSSFAPTFYNNLEATLKYTQTDVGSVASWSGAVTLNPARQVPEPATLPLLALGVVLVAIGFRRRVQG